MNKCHSNLNFVNDTTPALNDTNMNYMDGCIDTIDDRVVTFDTTKANQSDLLQTVKGITYNTSTGVITVTWWNGNTFTIDLNIEKIPVNFTMSAAGVITMTTADGTQYTADISTVLKLYTFVDSDEINFTVTQNGNNYTVTASIVEGSITADKLQPNFLADCEAAQAAAEAAADEAEAKALVSEGWAQGTQGGIPVGPDSPYYEKSAAYYAEATGGTSLAALNDVQISNPQNDQNLTYDSISGKWKNKSGGGIDDNDISTSKTWSSSKINQNLIHFATLPVSNLSAIAGDETVTLTWTNPSDVVVGGTKVAELETIRLYRDDVLIERALISTYTDTGLTTGQTYIYKVVAETTKGVDSAVATISATPVATGIQITITNAGANASVTVTDGTDTYTATADASGNASVNVATSGTYTITADGTGENKRYATSVTVGEVAVSVKMLNVPSQYKEVAYIESHGTEYIDTGINATSDVDLNLDFSPNEVPTTTSTWHEILGYYSGTSSRNVFFGYSNYLAGQSPRYNTAAINTYSDSSVLLLVAGGRYNLTVKDGAVKINGNTVHTDSASFTTSGHIYLFARNDNGTAGEFAKAKVERYTSKNNGILSLRYIPAVLMASGEAGLYDTVNDTFATNQGTGTFDYGCLEEDRIYLYNTGDEITSIGGSWKAMYSDTHAAISSTYFKKNASDMSISFESSSYGAGRLYKENKIDVTDYRKFCSLITFTRIPSSTPEFIYGAFAMNNLTDAWASALAGKNIGELNAFTDKTFSIDISGVDGQVYLMQTQYQMEKATYKKIWLEPVIKAPTETITLTLEGAKEDNITVKQNGATVGTCIFGSGQTTGTVTLDVPSDGSSVPYVFESSIAKDTTSGTSNYTKTVNVSKDTTTVKVMPDASVYWYGNECVDFTGGLRGTQTKWSSTDITITPTITKGTNSYKMQYNAGSSTYTYQYGSTNKIDVSDYNALKIRAEATNVGGAYGDSSAVCMDTSVTESWPWYALIPNGQGIKTLTLDLASRTGSKNIACAFRPSSHALLTTTMYALWLE